MQKSLYNKLYVLDAGTRCTRLVKLLLHKDRKKITVKYLTQERSEYTISSPDHKPGLEDIVDVAYTRNKVYMLVSPGNIIYKHDIMTGQLDKIKLSKKAYLVDTAPCTMDTLIVSYLDASREFFDTDSLEPLSYGDSIELIQSKYSRLFKIHTKKLSVGVIGLSKDGQVYIGSDYLPTRLMSCQINKPSYEVVDLEFPDSDTIRVTRELLDRTHTEVMDYTLWDSDISDPFLVTELKEGKPNG